VKSLSLTADFVFIRVRQRLTKTAFRTPIIIAVIKAFVSLCYHCVTNEREASFREAFCSKLGIENDLGQENKSRLTNSKAEGISNFS